MLSTLDGGLLLLITCTEASGVEVSSSASAFSVMWSRVMLCGNASLSQLADQSSLKSELGFFISDCGCALIHEYTELHSDIL